MSAIHLSSADLRHPAREVARGTARDLLRQVLSEATRLAILSGETAPRVTRGAPPPPEDPEAVHDFRVALRRLRSWLGAFRPLLHDTVNRKGERRLRDIARIAGRARDLEVARDWLTTRAGTRRSALAVECRRIARGLVRPEHRARRALIRTVVQDLPAPCALLAAQLQPLPANHDAARHPIMARSMGKLLRRRRDKLGQALDRLTRPDWVERFHQARIAGKRLRYLSEAFGSSSRLATGAVQRLSALQDEFGRLHDLQVLSRRLAREEARPVLRKAVRAELRAAGRRAQRLSRSADVAAAQSAITRLIDRLDHTGT